MFDQAAETYDKDFTYSVIGKLLREKVWNYLDHVLSMDQPLKILELNCGTGEDAIYLAQKGHQVVGLDMSLKMIEIAKQKVSGAGLDDKVDILKCDLREIGKCSLSYGFDLVFSNFGGLNCINRDKVEKLSCDLYHLMKPGARFIAVLMPRYCVWESLYFIAKFDYAKTFRRNTKTSIPVRVGNEMVDTWYYSPKDFENLTNQYFEKVAIKPVGFAIPPSYMENKFKERVKLLNLLDKIENAFNTLPGIASISDHFLIDMIKRKIA